VPEISPVIFCADSGKLAIKKRMSKKDAHRKAR
jgi:hypothetical protein